MVNPSEVDWLVEKGDGHGKDLSSTQVEQIKEVYQKIKPGLSELAKVEPGFKVDYETVRRFLVARQWNASKALDQMSKMIEWRTRNVDKKFKLEDSPIAQGNPYAVNLRCCGFDTRGRPVLYTAFSQAHDRFHPRDAIIHLRACLEECIDVIYQRRLDKLNTCADQLQTVWVIDFGGFSLRDQNPKTGILGASLMQNYPETLGLCVLVNAPKLFNGIWSIIKKLVDDHLKAKIKFTSTKSMYQLLESQVGAEMAKWLENEVSENIQIAKSRKKKAYWTAGEKDGDHDPRGAPGYITSKYYISTPGDKFVRESQGA